MLYRVVYRAGGGEVTIERAHMFTDGCCAAAAMRRRVKQTKLCIYI